MKKFIITGIVLAGITFSASALGLSVGAKGIIGTNIGTSIEETKTNLENDPTFSGGFGITADVGLFGTLGVRGGLNFVNSTVTAKSSSSGSQVQKLDTTMVDVPLMLHLALPIDNLSIGAGAGLNFSFILNPQYTLGSSITPENISTNGIKTGLVFGADLKFYIIKNLALTADVNYMLDFSPTKVQYTYKNTFFSTTTDAFEFTRRALYGGLGLEFRFF